MSKQVYRVLKRLTVVLFLAVMIMTMVGCSGRDQSADPAEETVDLTGRWRGTGSGASGLRATISSDKIVIKYVPTDDMSTVIWSGSYEPAKGDPPAFVSKNDYQYTKYLGTISTETLTFTYENGKLSFSNKPQIGSTKHYSLIRDD